MPELSISIPAYNDADTIESVIAEARQAARQIATSFEILVINDGSTDDTTGRLQQLLHSVPELRIHEHARNEGFGPTMAEVFTLPIGEWIWFIPGDGQVPADAVVKLYRHRHAADLLLARRDQRQDSIERWVASRVYNTLVSLVAGRRIHDVNAACLVRRSSVEEITLRSQSAFLQAELCLKILRRAGRLREISSPHRPRRFGRGAGNRPSVVLSTVRDLLQYVIRRPSGSPPVAGRAVEHTVN